jgi:hypothetical protein
VRQLIPFKKKELDITIYWTWDGRYLDTSGRTTIRLYTMIICGILCTWVWLAMNIGLCLGSANRLVDVEEIKHSISELTYIYPRCSYNPKKRDETTPFSSLHDHNSSLEFLIKINAIHKEVGYFFQDLHLIVPIIT